MAFVYKQKHVEDALPAFRVSRLSNPGLYSGLSGSKGNNYFNLKINFTGDAIMSPPPNKVFCQVYTTLDVFMFRETNSSMHLKYH